MKIGKIAARFVAIALLVSFARNVRAQTPDEDRAKEDLHGAKAVAKRHRDELMKIPHVRVVTAEIDGQSDAAILVEVDDEKNVDEVTRQLPSQLEGFPVEVDEGDTVDGSGSSITAGEFGDAAATAMPTPFPEVDKYGIYHHSWPAAPKTDAPE
jgi:hypothetical protein